MAFISNLRPLTCILSFLLISNTLISPVRSQSTPKETVRIEDSSSDIVYRNSQTSTSADSWTAFSGPQYNCPPGVNPCVIASINPAKVSQGTWHQARGPAVATYKFTGTGVSVHLAYNNEPSSTLELSFSIDGKETPVNVVGTGVNDDNGWVYDYTAFTTSNLAETEHTLVISQSTSNSVVLLDYLEVTGTRVASTSSPVTPTQSTSTPVMAPVVTSPPVQSSSRTTSQSPLVSTVFITSGSSTSTAITTILPSSTSGTSPTSSSQEEETSTSKSFPLVPVLVGSSGLVAAAIIILAVVIYIRRRKSDPKQQVNTLPTTNEPLSSQPSSSSRSSYHDSPFQPFLAPMPPVFTQPSNNYYANGMATRSQGSLVAQIDKMMASTNDNIIASSAIRQPQQNPFSPHPVDIYSPSAVSSEENVNHRPMSSSTAPLIPPSTGMFTSRGSPSPSINRPQPLVVPRESVLTFSSEASPQPRSGGGPSQQAGTEDRNSVVFMNEIPIYKQRWI